MRADNERNETAYRIANGLPEKPNVGSTSAEPDSNLNKHPTADIARLHSAMPKDPETEAYLAEYNVKSVALQTATDLAGLEKLCKREGAFFAVGEYFTRVGDHSLRNDWVEEVMAANAQRQQSRPIRTTTSQETHRQNPTEIAVSYTHLDVYKRQTLSRPVSQSPFLRARSDVGRIWRAG